MATLLGENMPMITAIRNASQEDLSHLHPNGTVAFLAPKLLKHDVEANEDGWVVMYVSTSLWHTCNARCAESKLHNILHCIDMVGYVLRHGREIAVKIVNFDADACRGMMELERKLDK